VAQLVEYQFEGSSPAAPGTSGLYHKTITTVNDDPPFGASLIIIIDDTVNYARNCSFIVLATVITIINYDL
jgi:hypothetical protein